MLKLPRSIPLATAAGLTAIYLTYLWQLGDTAHWGMSVIFFLAAASLLWDKQPQSTETQAIAAGLGIAVIAATLTLSLNLSDSEIFIRLMPLVFGIGVVLLAAGFRGFRLYWQELTLLFFLGVPRVIFSLIQDISPITAQFSGLLLWYVGLEPQVDGVYITLEERAIEVWEGCSGAESICYMLGIAVVCLMLFPVKGRVFQALSVVVAAVLGFVINAARVSLLAILAMKANTEAFVYWHEGDGSLLFGTGSVLLFGLLYWLVSQVMQEPASLSSNSDAA